MSNDKKTVLTAEKLTHEFGPLIKPEDLSEFLGIDKRTLLKHSRFWGGIEVYPGRYRFFEKDVKERLENARTDNKTWKEAMARFRNDKRGEKATAVSRRNQGIEKSGCKMGGRNSGAAGSRPDKHGIFNNAGVGQ
ncbi:MAG TPA: hypothetical protein VK885_11295 [Desulfotignum sp.]|nr:hypothetical protein [Desulfotignum sp.]